MLMPYVKGRAQSFSSCLRNLSARQIDYALITTKKGRGVRLCHYSTRCSCNIHVLISSFIFSFSILLRGQAICITPYMCLYLSLLEIFC